MNKNIYLLSVIFALFAADVYKVKYYPDPVKPLVQDEPVVERKQRQLPQEGENITDDDLRLEDDTDSSSPRKSRQSHDPYAHKISLMIQHCNSNVDFLNNFKKELLSNIADVEVEAGLYPPDQEKQLYSRILTYVQLALVIIIIGGSMLKDYLKFIPASVFNFIESKKVFLGIASYFGINFLQSKLNNTGAFEVYYGGELLWSTLKNKALPTLDNITQALVELGISIS